MSHGLLLKSATLFLALIYPCFLQAGVFSSKDGAFTLDMPAGWVEVKNPPQDGVLSIQNANARLDVKTVACQTETCIEEKITADLADVKSKKMKVVGNSYTGEEIKRIEFSTGDPFFYISFFTPKTDFSSGYFLIDGKAYSILAKNLTYAQTDLIFSFISPLEKAPAPEALEMDLQDPRAYDIAALPAVQEETLTVPLEAAAPAPTVQTVEPKKTFRTYLRSLKNRAAALKINTLLSKRMPPYLQRLGHGFDALIALLVLFFALQGLTLLLRPFIHPRKNTTPTNPNSLYPIRFVRLYGTPSLIFRAKDNQGNVLISLSSRWDSLFLFSGLWVIILTLLVLTATSVGEKSGLLPLSAFAYSTIYSACSLVIPLGAVVFFCGVVWSQLVLREITLFDRKGKKAAIVLQKGFGIFQERYEIYFARSKDVLTVTRKRFSFKRSWRMFNREGNALAQITERSFWRTLLRKVCGHQWGFLRADYVIKGQMDSQGSLESMHTVFNQFVCNLDKPQALNARDLLAVALLINIRDKDKWYPWFN